MAGLPSLHLCQTLRTTCWSVGACYKGMSKPRATGSHTQVIPPPKATSQKESPKCLNSNTRKGQVQPSFQGLLIKGTWPLRRKIPTLKAPPWCSSDARRHQGQADCSRKLGTLRITAVPSHVWPYHTHDTTPHEWCHTINMFGCTIHMVPQYILV